KERQNSISKLSEIPQNEEALIIATGRFLGEGFDISRLDTMFLTMPFSWKGTLTQYVGRLYRKCENKTEITVYDYVDENVEVLNKMFKKRERGYKALGFTTKIL
ncbi:MAG: hypothetical protein LUG16_02810, partial [Candidatus Gastranaerophilales bacterium]|nr:hypothetical protein [Candidatus Gastranaerophilales bacterium]